MNEEKTGSKKSGIYTLIALGMISILFGILVIVGGAFIEYKIIAGVNQIHEKVDEAYQVTDNTVVSAKNFVDKIDTGFNKIAPLVVLFSDADKQEVIGSIDRLHDNVKDVQRFLDDTQSSVNSVNDKIDIVNSFDIVRLSNLSGERVQNATSTVNEFSDTLDELKEDIESDSVSQKVVDKVNEGIQDTQGIFSEYQTQVGDSRKQATDFKNLIIFWSMLGTIFIIGFFAWSIYSFYYFTRSQFAKLKIIKEKEIE